MIKAFVDTGPLFEYGAAQEQLLFEKTRLLLISPDYQWYSSTYIFDELMTLLVTRVPKKKVIDFGDKLRASSRLIWIHPTLEDEEEGWKVFRTHTDKLWSFTDCLSYHLIKKNNIRSVLSFDRDFTQMGFQTL